LGIPKPIRLGKIERGGGTPFSIRNEKTYLKTYLIFN